MEVRKKKSIINPKFKYITIEEYDFRDIIDYERKFTRSDVPVVYTVLRKRLNHINYKEDTHPRSNIVKGMASAIFFEYMKIVVEELFKGNKVKMKKIGTVYLRTKKSVASYKGYISDKQRCKIKGFYTMIKVDWEFMYKNIKYREPYFAFGPGYKKRLHEYEDNGIKY